jgi:hypothetical protein
MVPQYPSQTDGVMLAWGVQDAKRAFTRFQLEGQMICVQSTRSLRDKDSKRMLCDQSMQLLGTGLFEVTWNVHRRTSNSDDSTR